MIHDENKNTMVEHDFVSSEPTPVTGLIYCPLFVEGGRAHLGLESQILVSFPARKAMFSSSINT